MKARLASLSRHVGRRGAFLLFLALLDLIYCFGLAVQTEQSRRSETMVYLAGVLPLPLWAALWGVVGLLCLVFAFRHNDGLGYAAAMFVKALWAIVFLLGWLFAGVERGYLSAAFWGAFAAVVGLHTGWEENPPKEER